MLNILQAWLASHQPAMIDDISLLPRLKQGLSAEPLVTQGDESTLYHVVDEDQNGWLIKKFCLGHEPEPSYAAAIQLLVPDLPGLESGFGRKRLGWESVRPEAWGNDEFRAWIEGTVLIPEVIAPTWAELTESIRDGSRLLSNVERLLLCQKLSEKVSWLEAAGLAHRDLSSRNVMIDPTNVEIHLIDWDGLYAPQLSLPAHANCGTEGYVAPIANCDEFSGVELTWCSKADRFSLAVLNAELLVVRTGSRPFGRSGLLDQEEIHQRTGRTLDEVRNSLRLNFPAVLNLFDEALAAQSFDDCPGPNHWLDLTASLLEATAASVWDEENSTSEEESTIYSRPYEPHFVEIDETIFVKIDPAIFVKAPDDRRH